MKLLAILFLCGCAFSVSSGDEGKDIFKQLVIGVPNNIGNPIDALWRQALEFVRALLKKYEPLEVPDMPVQTVTGDGISLTAKFDKVRISKADNFIIDKIENNIFSLSAKFQVTVPAMHIDGSYTVTGTVQGKNVNGNGDFSLDIDSLVTGGNIKVAFKGAYLQMTQFDMHYTIENLNFSETGLEVEGMTHEQVEELFHQSFLKYFQENEKFVCSQVSVYTMEQANKIMHDKSLQGLLDWLKNFIHGKIIPY